MDGNLSTLIPESWASRVLDILGTIMLVVMKTAHGRFEKKMDAIQTLQTEHEVFRNRLVNIEDDVGETKGDVKEMAKDIKELLKRGGKDWRH